jgi:predicted nucleic acid-binding protein
MKIYLDACSLQRPLDNKNQIRVALEAEAILGVLALCEAGDLELISSEVLVFEVEHTPQLSRREYGREVLAKAKSFVSLRDAIEGRAHTFTTAGVKPLDALHLASAEEARADFFCTCDDRFLKKARNLPGLKVKVVSPVELAEEFEP